MKIEKLQIHRFRASMFVDGPGWRGSIGSYFVGKLEAVAGIVCGRWQCTRANSQVTFWTQSNEGANDSSQAITFLGESVCDGVRKVYRRMDEAGSRARIAAYTARKLSGAPPLDEHTGASQELQEVMEAKSVSVQVRAATEQLLLAQISGAQAIYVIRIALRKMVYKEVGWHEDVLHVIVRLHGFKGSRTFNCASGMET